MECKEAENMSFKKENKEQLQLEELIEIHIYFQKELSEKQFQLVKLMENHKELEKKSS